MAEHTAQPTDLPAALPAALPPGVAAFLAAAPTAEPGATAALFAEEAVVVDDGHTYRGREEIAAWRSGAAQAFHYTKTLLSWDYTAPVVEVTERLEGDFPGGRVDLKSVFEVEESGLIAALRIAAAS